MVSPALCQDVHGPSIDINPYKSSIDIIKDYDEHNTIAESGSSQSKMTYYAEGPFIDIEKYTLEFKNVYNKNENITIRVKILNCNQKNRLENVYISEEIPQDFELVSVNQNGCKIIKNTNSPNIMQWVCEDVIISSKCYEYVIRTNKSGNHIFSNPTVKTTVIDNNGRKNQLILSSGDPISLTIKNTPPEFYNMSPEPPINIRDFFGDKYITVEATLRDPDYDSINCKLRSNGYNLRAPTNTSQWICKDPNNKYRYCTYIWDISDLDRRSHILTLEATDGDEKTISRDIELNVYRIPPNWISNLAAIIATIVAIVVGSVIVIYIKNKQNNQAESAEVSLNGEDDNSENTTEE